MLAIKKLTCLVLALLMLTMPCIAADTSADTSSQTDTSATGTADTATGATDASAETDTDPTPTSSVAADTKTGDAIKFSDVDYESELGKAVEKLVDNNVISGFPDGTFKSEQTLTRAEFSKIIVSFTAGEETSVNLDSGFPDVDNVGGSAHWAKAYIKVAKDLKIISGFPDGTFKPDDAVTYEQAIKMIMCALNYTDYTYPDGFMQIALQKKLLTGSLHTGANSDSVTRGTTAILMKNAYSVPENKASALGGISVGGSSGGSSGGGGGSSSSGGGGGGGGSSSDEYTRKVYGVIVGNEYTMLDSNSYLDKGELAVKYTMKDSKTGESSVVTEVFSVADAYKNRSKSYLGRNVQITLKEKDGKEYISYMKITENDNREFSVRSRDVLDISYNSEDKTATITYDDNNSEDSITFGTENAYIIYNGNSINVRTEEEPEKAYEFDPKYLTEFSLGTITVLSTEKSFNNARVIFIEDYKTAIVKSKPNSDTGVITLDYGLGTLNAKSKGNRIVEIYKDGFESTLSDIKSGDVIDYAESVDKNRMQILVSSSDNKSNYVSGQIYKIGENSVTIVKDNKKTEYTLNYNYKEYLKNYTGSDKYEPLADDDVTVYFSSFKNLDGNNLVADIELKDDSANYRLGYIYALYFAENESDKSHDIPQDGDKTYLVMYDMNSSAVKTYGLTDKVRIDGKEYNKKPEEVKELIMKAAEISNTGKSTDLNSVITYAQIIRFKIDTSSKITEIDTLLNEEGEISTEVTGRYNKLVRTKYVYDDSETLGGRHKYSSSARKFYKKSTSDGIAINSSTKWLFVPGRRSDSKKYKSGTGTSQFSDGVEYYIEAYSTSTKASSTTAELILQFISDGSGAIKYNSTQAVVFGTDQAGSDEPVQVKLRTSAGKEVTLDRHSESPVTEDEFMALSPGDVILYSVKDNCIYDYFMALDIDDLPVERIDDESLLYCTDEDNDRRIKAFSSTPSGKQAEAEKIRSAYYMTMYGTADDMSLDKSTGRIYVNPVLGTDYIEPSEGLTQIFDFSYSGVKLFIYDENEKKDEDKLKVYTTSADVKAALEDEEAGIYTAEANGGEYDGADQVFIFAYTSSSSKENEIKYIYIIRRSTQQSDPANYSGVKDPVDKKKETAKVELVGYVSMTDYSKNTAEYVKILSEGQAAIDEASTMDEIEEKLAEAKAKFDALAKDSDKAEAVSSIEEYVNLDDYSYFKDDMESIIEDAESEINSAVTNAEVTSAVTEAKASLLSKAAEDAKAALDAYIDDNGYTVDSDALEAYKAGFDGAESPSELADALAAAKSELAADETSEEGSED